MFRLSRALRDARNRPDEGDILRKRVQMVPEVIRTLEAADPVILNTLERVAATLNLTLQPRVQLPPTTVRDAAERIYAADDAGNAAHAYRMLIQLSDELADASPELAAVISLDPPPRAHSRYQDAVAGIVELRLSEKKAVIPEWVLVSYGDYHAQWHPLESEDTTRPMVEPSRVPIALRRRGVYIDAAELESDGRI